MEVDEKKSRIREQPPEEFTGIKVKNRKKEAGGFAAIFAAFDYSLNEMDLSTTIKTLRKVNQKDGFDCPGCAWPDPEKRSRLGELCENGAKAVAEEATKRRVTPEFFKKYTVRELSQKSDYWLGKAGRITHPVILKEDSDHYEPISWEDAFNHIGEKLKSLPSPDNAIFYTSGRTSNEAAFLYQLFVREYGTNNLPDCSNMCHESSGVGLSETLGIGKGSVTLEDFYKTELIIIAGQNPGTNHPRMLTALQKAKKNGSKIITINPLPEAGLIGFRHPQHLKDFFSSPTKLTDLFLQVRINGDVPLFKAINKSLIEKGKNDSTVIDKDFIESRTHGFDDYLRDLDNHDFNSLVEQSGIHEDKIREAVELISEKNKIIVCWAMGLTQHKNGVDNIQEIVNLLLLKGSIGKPGAGTCPVRGHSNVQGDRTVGIWESPKPQFLDKLKDTFGFDPPRHSGYNTVDSINAMAVGKASIFFSMGGNFLSATPDTELTAKALQNCELTVQVSTKLNRSHLVHGKEAIILPCLGRTEKDVQQGKPQFVSVENSVGIVHQSRGGKDPASEHLLSEPEIVARMAKATLGSDSKVDWEHLISDYDHIRDLIEKVVPGFDDYNKRVRNPGGFYLPNCAREGKFETDVKKARFSITRLPDQKPGLNEYLMTTIRSHDQFNTTIYGLDDRYRGVYNERRVVLMNSGDMQNAGLKQEDVVNLVSNYNGIKRVARHFLVVPYDIPEKCVATYFPEANVLVPVDHFADKSHTPASKSVLISIKKAEV